MVDYGKDVVLSYLGVHSWLFFFSQKIVTHKTGILMVFFLLAVTFVKLGFLLL